MKKIFMKKKSKLRDNNTVDEENKENFSNKLNSNASSSTSTNSLIKPLRNLLSFKHKNTKQMNTDKKGNLCDNKNLHSMADKENQENCQMVLMPKPLENVEDTIGETLSTLPINSSTKPFRSFLNFHEKRVMIDKKENSYDNLGLEISEIEGNKKNCKMDLMPKLLDNTEFAIGEASLDLLMTPSKKSFRSFLNYPKHQTRDIIDKKENLSENMELEIIETEKNEKKCQLDVMPKPPENVESAISEASSALPTTSKKSFKRLLSFRHKNARRGNTDGKGKLSDNIGLGIPTGENNKDNYKSNLMSNPLENVKTTLGEASLTSSNLTSSRPLKDLLNLPRIFKQKNNVQLEEHSAPKMKKMSKKTKNMEVEIDQKVDNELLDMSNRDLIVAPKNDNFEVYGRNVFNVNSCASTSRDWRTMKLEEPHSSSSSNKEKNKERMVKLPPSKPVQFNSQELLIRVLPSLPGLNEAVNTIITGFLMIKDIQPTDNEMDSVNKALDQMKQIETFIVAQCTLGMHYDSDRESQSETMSDTNSSNASTCKLNSDFESVCYEDKLNIDPY